MAVLAMLVPLRPTLQVPTLGCHAQQPKIGGEVRPHQDSTFLHTDPPSVVGLWWALEDSTRQNGCLWALPGSHRGGVARRFVKACACAPRRPSPGTPCSCPLAAACMHLYHLLFGLDFKGCLSAADRRGLTAIRLCAAQPSSHMPLLYNPLVWR